MKDRIPLRYWALLVVTTLAIIAIVQFMESDTFKSFIAVGANAVGTVLRLLLIGALLLFMRWWLVDLIGDGVANGIRKANLSEHDKKAKGTGAF